MNAYQILTVAYGLTLNDTNRSLWRFKFSKMPLVAAADCREETAVSQRVHALQQIYERQLALSSRIVLAFIMCVETASHP